MATRKSTKKQDTIILEMPGTIGAAKLILPQIVKGTHLTVTTFPDGKTELEWDDDQLLKEVREALALAESSQKKAPRKSKTK